MTTRMLLVFAAAACLAACGEKATVEGEGGRKLELVKPAGVTIPRGDMAKVDVRIRRRELAGDVMVRFDKLPAGVTVVDADQRIVGDDATYTLRAAESADLVENYAAQVTASSGDLAVTETVEIDVVEKRAR